MKAIMKTLLLGGIGALAIAGSAAAADLSPMYTKAPPPAPAWSWTGFYVGVNGGYGWGTDSVTFSPASAANIYFTSGAVPGVVNTNPAGGLFGIQLGYNWQWTPNWVFGVETDIDWADISGSGTVNTAGIVGFDPFSTFAQQRVTALGTFRGRVGYALDGVLLYATGGLAYGRTQLNTSITDVLGGRLCGPAGECAAASSSQWMTGWAAGAGVDWAFAPQWSLRAEYLHYDLGSRNQNQLDPAFPVPVFNSSATFRGDIVRGAINFKLN